MCLYPSDLLSVCPSLCLSVCPCDLACYDKHTCVTSVVAVKRSRQGEAESSIFSPMFRGPKVIVLSQRTYLCAELCRCCVRLCVWLFIRLDVAAKLFARQTNTRSNIFKLPSLSWLMAKRRLPLLYTCRSNCRSVFLTTWFFVSVNDCLNV